MPVSLEFDNTHKYTEAADGINVPITLAIGSQSVDLLAKLDTGAAHCIFERKYAEILGLDPDKLPAFLRSLQEAHAGNAAPAPAAESSRAKDWLSPEIAILEQPQAKLPFYRWLRERLQVMKNVAP
jgi:hypothetical protein